MCLTELLRYKRAENKIKGNKDYSITLIDCFLLNYIGHFKRFAFIFMAFITTKTLVSLSYITPKQK